jgi:dTDP-3-amino-3,4,6-trideoxy-alpha-D-glucose transaminase
MAFGTEMNVPFFSSSHIPQGIKSEWMNEIARVIESESLISGMSVLNFESEFARYVGADFAIGVSNGLDGLVLSLRAAGIGTGHVVAVPGHTFIATFLAVIHVGATPHAVDVDSQGLLDLDKLFSLNIKIDAVIPVHMHGCMVDMKSLMTWSKTKGIVIVEDASQAHGCVSKGVRAGELGDLAVFSLYPTKNLGALGDAGIVTTSKASYHEYIKSARTYGSSRESKYLHTHLGYNARLDTIHAAVLRINLKHLDHWNLHRKKLAGIYRERLSHLPIEILISEGADSVYHHFPILLRERDILREHLAGYGVGTEIHYPNLASTEISKILSMELEECATAESISTTTLSLPLSQWHSEKEIAHVAEVVADFFER